MAGLLALRTKNAQIITASVVAATTVFNVPVTAIAVNARMGILKSLAAVQMMARLVALRMPARPGPAKPEGVLTPTVCHHCAVLATTKAAALNARQTS